MVRLLEIYYVNKRKKPNIFIRVFSNKSIALYCLVLYFDNDIIQAFLIFVDAVSFSVYKQVTSDSSSYALCTAVFHEKYLSIKTM